MKGGKIINEIHLLSENFIHVVFTQIFSRRTCTNVRSYVISRATDKIFLCNQKKLIVLTNMSESDNASRG